MKMKFLFQALLLRRPEDGQGGAPTPPPDMSDDTALRETLAFDPSTFFAPPAKDGSGDGDGDGAAPGDAAPGGAAPGAGGGAASQPPAPTPSSPSDQAPKEGEDPLAALRASVQDLLTKKPEPAKTPEAPPTPPAQGDQSKEPAGYDFTIPLEVVEALNADEPAVRQRAVSGLITGVANKLAKDFSAAMATMAQHVQRQAVEAALAQVQSQTETRTVKEDFYSNFPDLKRMADALPAMDGAIWQTVSQVAQNTGVKAWTPEFRNQVGALIRVQLGLQQQGAPPPAAAPQGRPPARAPFNAGGGGSGGRPNGAADSANDFLAVLGAGGG